MNLVRTAVEQEDDSKHFCLFDSIIVFIAFSKELFLFTTNMEIFSEMIESNTIFFTNRRFEQVAC